MKSFIAAVVLVLLFFLALLFGAKNDQIVTISYFIAQGEFRLPVVLASVFISGFLISWVLASFYLIKMKIKLRKATKKITALENNPQSIQANTEPKS